MNISQQRVTDAVNHLIAAPNCAALVNEMTRIIETWSTHPMAYGGGLRHLNAMVDVGLQDRLAFERLVKLVEERRRLAPQTRRVDYQRELMQVRRAREAKAVELQEMLSGPMRGARRIQYLIGLRERWRAERARHISSKGDLDWKARNEAAAEFWEIIDRNLELNVRAARRKRA